MENFSELIKAAMTGLAYCQALGILVSGLVGVCQLFRKENPIELERALFRSKSWPSKPGCDPFSTGTADNLLNRQK